MSTQKTWYEKKRLRLTQGYIDQNIYSTDETTGEVKIIGKYESGIDAYKKSKVKLDSKLLGHLISRAQTREKCNSGSTDQSSSGQDDGSYDQRNSKSDSQTRGSRSHQKNLLCRAL